MLFASALVLILSAHAGKNKQVPNTTIHPGMVEEVANLKVTVAAQKCENFAWAATLETALRSQKVDLPQQYWTDRVTGGRCEDTAPALEETARLLNGDFKENGVAFHIATQLIPGAPRRLDDLLMSLRQSRAAIIYWRSHPYVLVGVVYDEAIYPTGNKLFEARELHLLDATAPGREAKFIRDSDDANEIDGVLLIAVTGLE